MHITFHSNLDLAREYIPPTMGLSWDHVPAVGTYVNLPLPSMFGHQALPQLLELQVSSVRYSMYGEATVELHIPSYDKRSVAEWEKWMKRRLGRE